MAPHLIVQLSDVHLTSKGALRNGARPLENLVAALGVLDSADIRPDVLLLTGDLADAGEPGCYDELAQLVDKSAAASGASVVYVPGNHDDRAAFRRHLLGEGGDHDPNEPVNQVHHRDGLRIVAVDSTVPGTDGGDLAEATVAFLRRTLSTPAPDGTVLALHHPPISTPIQPMAAIALRRPDLLAQAIAGTDVRLICCGHNHHPAAGSLGGVPVWAGPATAYLADVTSREVFRGLPGSAFSRIDLGVGGPLVTVVPVA